MVSALCVLWLNNVYTKIYINHLQKNIHKSIRVSITFQFTYIKFITLTHFSTFSDFKNAWSFVTGGVTLTTALAEFACPMPGCSRRYLNKHSLKRHIKYECADRKQHVCPLCQRRFSHGFVAVRHLILVHKFDKQNASMMMMPRAPELY